MSKLIDDLNKVKEAREGQLKAAVSPVDPSTAAVQRYKAHGISGAIPSILLVIVAVVSVAVNITTIAELKDMRESMSFSMTRHMEGQKKELAALSESLERTEAAKERQKRQIAGMRESLKNIKASLETFKSAAARIEDLKVNDRLMLEKFIALNDKVKKIEDETKNLAEIKSAH